MNLQEALQRLGALDSANHALAHAMGLLTVDGSTIAPRQSWRGRARTMGYLAEEQYRLFAAPENREAMDTVLASRDQCAPVEVRRAEVLLERLEKMTLFSREEHAAYASLIAEADSVWKVAKARSDYALFAPYVTQVFAHQRTMARRKDPDRPAYDVLLDGYEKGTDTAQLDPFFDLLRTELTPLIREIARRPAPRTDFLHRYYDVERQRLLSDRVMEMMGLDRERCAIAETEHPFTSGLNRWDVRISTHYHTDDVSSSLYSVMHEGGHALYELGVADDLQFTCLGKGSSMAIHESQSRFYENIIGRSQPFIEALYPVMREIFPAEFADVTARELHLAVNEVRPSLIRTQADELTYPLHVAIRYEIEKRMLAGDVKTEELPALWNSLYRELLGVTPENDREGILQDSHWSTGLVGYFPSYALGSAYDAQYLPLMERDVPDLWQRVGAGDLSPVTRWLGERIHRHGLMKTPGGLLASAGVDRFDPACYVRYLKNKYTALYGL